MSLNKVEDFRPRACEDLAFRLGAVAPPRAYFKQVNNQDGERFVEEVLECVRVSGITQADLNWLDQGAARNIETPNGEWRWKLRAIRKTDRGQLFEVLAGNTRNVPKEKKK